MGKVGDSGEKKGLWGERSARGEEVATVEKETVVRERGVGVEVPGTEGATNTDKKVFVKFICVSINQGESRVACPGTEESMMFALVVVDMTFVEARMGVDPVINQNVFFVGKSFFLLFFLYFRRPNLITGLSGWRTPD